jgi:hypothetical protein
MHNPEGRTPMLRCMIPLLAAAAAAVASSGALGQVTTPRDDLNGPFVRWGVENENGEFRFGVPTPFSVKEDGNGGFVYEISRQDLTAIDTKGTANTADDVLEATVSFSVVLKTDPYILYAFTVTDIGAPSIFTFGALNPLVPIVPNGTHQVKAAFGGRLTDFTGNGAAINQIAGVPIQTAVLNPGPVGMGVDVGPSASIAAGPSGQVLAYGNTSTAFPMSGDAFVAPGPAFLDYAPLAGGPFTQMKADWRFSLSGGGDSFAGIGYVEIVPVPEPGTVLLMLAGLGGLAVVARRRKQI